ncbi:O-antigen ligase family protein [Parablautia sp. Marseille-Q6255]|uniref:O-antigen ligase family protein n=1 Tax=Parablautia sp. Marseille-Q6255 TaxID=3039593 RepID=UPI0024BC704F|nr:O-antigen ligase family protein [Parablautia sp. Marseille-Q6255]
MNDIRVRKSTFCKLVCLLCFLTNIGQTPFLIDNYQTRYIVIPLWLAFVIICILKNHVISFWETRSIFLLFTLFCIIYGIGAMFIDNYMASSLPYVIVLSMFILFTGIMTGKNLERDDIQSINTAFIWSSVIVCVDTFLTYVYGNSLDSRIYSYDSKNSVSQILLTAWILIPLFKFDKVIPKVKRIIYLSVFILLTVTLLGLKSRATLIGIPIIIAWWLLHGNLNRRLRNILILGLFGLAIFLVINPDFTNNIFYNVVLGGRDINDINDLSSGRFIEWQSFMDDFLSAPIFGHGRMKRESIILTSLLEFGIIGGGIILYMAVWPIIWAVRYVGKSDDKYLMISSIALVYIVNGIFEQLAPFGPGVKCYYLWFVIGILVSVKGREYINSLEYK